MRLHREHGARRACSERPCLDTHEYISPVSGVTFTDVSLYPFADIDELESVVDEERGVLGHLARGYRKRWDAEAVTRQGRIRDESTATRGSTDC